MLYTATLPGSANNYIWIAQQALKEISHIQFYAGSNMYIVDIDNLQNYLDIVIKKETSADDFQTMDSINGLYPNNCVVNVVPALRNSNRTNAPTINGPTNPSSRNYDEPAYYQVGTAVAAPVTYNIQFPLRLIKNSAFSIDKNMYFGQITYLKIYFGPISKICYVSTSNTNPSAGTKGSYPSALLPNISGTLQLMLAVETNQGLRQQIIDKVSTTGLSYMIPFVQGYKNSNAGTSQNVSIQLDQGNGRSLMKVYHAVYNNQEDYDTAYDHANNQTVAGVASAANQKAPPC